MLHLAMIKQTDALYIESDTSTKHNITQQQLKNKEHSNNLYRRLKF